MTIPFNYNLIILLVDHASMVYPISQQIRDIYRMHNHAHLSFSQVLFEVVLPNEMVFKQFPISHSAALPKFLSSRLLVVKEFQILKQAAKCRVSNLSQIFQNFTFVSAQPFCKSCQNVPINLSQIFPHFTIFLLCHSATLPFSCFAKAPLSNGNISQK